MTRIKKAVKYIHEKFEYEIELRSYCQDITPDGVFTKKQFDKFPADVQMDVAEDLQYQFKQEFGYLFN